MAHCIRTFTEEISDYSRKLVGIVQHIEGGEQIVEDGLGMAHTEHVWIFLFPLYLLNLFILIFLPLLIIIQLQWASTTLDGEHKFFETLFVFMVFIIYHIREFQI